MIGMIFSCGYFPYLKSSKPAEEEEIQDKTLAISPNTGPPSKINANSSKITTLDGSYIRTPTISKRALECSMTMGFPKCHFPHLHVDYRRSIWHIAKLALETNDTRTYEMSSPINASSTMYS